MPSKPKAPAAKKPKAAASKSKATAPKTSTGDTPKKLEAAARKARKVVAQATGLASLGQDQVWRESTITALDFKTTEELEIFDGVIEQDRATQALELGLAINRHMYNIYVSGFPGTGRTTVVRKLLDVVAPVRDTPCDWVYVNDFDIQDRPIAVSLPPGDGTVLKEAVAQLVPVLMETLPNAFHSKEHQERIQRVINASIEVENNLFATLNQAADKHGFSVKSTKTGLATIPMVKGEPLSTKELGDLPEKKRRAIEKKRTKLEPLISAFLEQTRENQVTAQNAINDAQAELGGEVMGPALAPLRKQWKSSERVVQFFDALQKDVLEHLGSFLDDSDDSRDLTKQLERRYAVNVVVDHSETKGAPVVFESHPNYYNLFGKVEKRAEQGTLTTDVTMIRAGAVQRASGGYLVLNTVDVFSHPLVWDNLKAVLRNRQVQIEDMADQVSFVPTTGLRPKPIPVDLKVILIGRPDHWAALFHGDPDFRKYFQVKADFDAEIHRDGDTEYEVARFIATSCRKHELRPVDKAGVGAMIEYAGRMVSDQGRLTLRFNDIANLLMEANYQATKARRKIIGKVHVDRALKLRDELTGLVPNKFYEAIVEERVNIATTGESIGRVNGLAVYDMGDRSFGKPVRISATTFAGKSGIINVEREAKLAGRIYNKGVLILHGYLGDKYAQDGPLALSVTLTMEQSYGRIDGDSASSTELYAIISSLAGVPLRQDLAVTGSVSQAGEVQAIGGANEKVEGFFEVCQRRRLTGLQGVMLPATNARNLMLKAEVRAAIGKGKFHVYPVETIDQGLELLTGMPAAEVHRRAQARIKALRQPIKSADKPAQKS